MPEPTSRPTTGATPERDLRPAFLAAADHVIAIVSRDDVAAAWHRPSALPEWSVGGLVAHLASQPVTALALLRAEPATDAIALDEHYARSAWVSTARTSQRASASPPRPCPTTCSRRSWPC